MRPTFLLFKLVGPHCGSPGKLMYHLDGIFSDATSSLQVQFLPVLYTLTEWQLELFSASVLLFLGV